MHKESRPCVPARLMGRARRQAGGNLRISERASVDKQETRKKRAREEKNNNRGSDLIAREENLLVHTLLLFIYI